MRVALFTRADVDAVNARFAATRACREREARNTDDAMTRAVAWFVGGALLLLTFIIGSIS